jgi:hypothetical protein
MTMMGIAELSYGMERLSCLGSLRSALVFVCFRPRSVGVRVWRARRVAIVWFGWSMGPVGTAPAQGGLGPS